MILFLGQAFCSRVVYDIKIRLSRTTLPNTIYLNLHLHLTLINSLINA